jgi:uncharacterized protein
VQERPRRGVGRSRPSPRPVSSPSGALRSFVLKVASRCNLDCTYCYVYNKGDTTWKRRPAQMSDSVFDAALARIRESCESSGQDEIAITFHGGEPCLIGASRFDEWCTRATAALDGVASVDFSIQTNGTLLDAGWARVLAKHDVNVGVSVDGPKESHDLHRVDHHGRGSYDAVERGIGALRAAGVPFGILTVVPLGGDPLPIHRHFLTLGADRLTYLLPDFTHDTIAPVRAQYGETPCAHFLIPVFDDWWLHGTLDVRIADFWNIARVILGGASEIETIGNRPPLYAFVEADGDIEGLDVLRVCGEGMAGTGLNVRDAAFSEIAQASVLHRQAIFEGMPLPQGCHTCPENATCAGGYLPHRYSRSNGFDNPSVWCADLLKLFGWIRRRLGVSVEETNFRRARLLRMPGPSVLRARRAAPSS